MTHHPDLKGHRTRNRVGGGRAGKGRWGRPAPGRDQESPLPLALYHPLVEKGSLALRLPGRVSQTSFARLGGWGGRLDFLSLRAAPWTPQPSLGSHPPTRSVPERTCSRRTGVHLPRDTPSAPLPSLLRSPTGAASAVEVPHWPVHPAPLHALQGPAGVEAKF